MGPPRGIEPRSAAYETAILPVELQRHASAPITALFSFLGQLPRAPNFAEFHARVGRGLQPPDFRDLIPPWGHTSPKQSAKADCATGTSPEQSAKLCQSGTSPKQSAKTDCATGTSAKQSAKLCQSGTSAKQSAKADCAARTSPKQSGKVDCVTGTSAKQSAKLCRPGTLPKQSGKVFGPGAPRKKALPYYARKGFPGAHALSNQS